MLCRSVSVASTPSISRHSNPNLFPISFPQMLARSSALSRSLTAAARRNLSAKSLKEVLRDQIPAKQEALKKLKKEYGDRSLGEVTVDQCIGGGRDVKCMYYETSLLDAQEGIRFRGFSIPELQQKLPTFKGTPGDGEPIPEALIYLLLTSEIPTVEQARALGDELRSRAKLPPHVEPMIRAFPKGMHPMTQLSIALLACQTDSKFAAAYSKGVNKSKYWEYTYEDVLDVIAKLPELSALIYRCTFKDGVVKKDTSGKLDYSASFCRMLGYDDPAFDELMRLYLVIHSDHEGGNASAHATHLVGSTLSDPYLAYSGGLNALAGPLHGLANQEVLSWIQQLQAKFLAEGIYTVVSFSAYPYSFTKALALMFGRQGGEQQDHHRVCLGDSQGWQGHPRLRPRRAAQDRSKVHLPARLRH